MLGKIFIVMPAYNAGATIEKVFSRIPQRVRDGIERYVVVNDGSTDDTNEALDRLSGRYANLVTDSILRRRFLIY
jgi:glycosyltransferase involved in cell wall biosynthesis